ncbi:MAG: hypothetical protein ACRDAM_12570 [Casimicrobium sp.]
MDKKRPKAPPKPPAHGCVKITIEGKEAILEEFRDTLQKMFGIRFEWSVKDSDIHKDCKFQRIEVQVLP